MLSLLSATDVKDEVTFPHSYDRSVPEPSSYKETEVQVNESLISLLIKLHNKLSDKEGSYIPLTTRGGTIDPSNHVGGGPFFVGRLLDSICAKSGRCSQVVEAVYKDLLPKTSQDSSSLSTK